MITFLQILFFFILTFNSYSMINDPSLGLGTKYEKDADWEKAIENYKLYLTKNFNHPDSLVVGTFKLGRALQLAGKEKEAIEKYEDVTKLYTRYKNLIDPFTLEYVANAKFILIEPIFLNATSPYKDKNKPLDKFTKEREGALDLLKKRYEEVIKLNVTEWTMASLYKIGLAYELTSYSILNAPLPEETATIKREEFYLNLKNQGLPFEDRAITIYKEVMDLNKKHTVGHEWAKFSAQRLENLK